MTFAELHNRCNDPLIERDNGGIYVGMFYDRKTEDVFIWYCDTKEEIDFVLNPPKFLALDAYIHPIVYAKGALNGTENPLKLVPVPA